MAASRPTAACSEYPRGQQDEPCCFTALGWSLWVAWDRQGLRLLLLLLLWYSPAAHRQVRRRPLLNLLLLLLQPA